MQSIVKATTNGFYRTHLGKMKNLEVKREGSRAFIVLTWGEGGLVRVFFAAVSLWIILFRFL